MNGEDVFSLTFHTTKNPFAAVSLDLFEAVRTSHSAMGTAEQGRGVDE